MAPAEPSASVTSKKKTRRTAEGWEVHSFRTLRAELGKRCRNHCQITCEEPEATFTQLTDRTPLQEEAMRLLNLL